MNAFDWLERARPLAQRKTTESNWFSTSLTSFRRPRTRQQQRMYSTMLLLPMKITLENASKEKAFSRSSRRSRRQTCSQHERRRKFIQRSDSKKSIEIRLNQHQCQMRGWSTAAAAEKRERRKRRRSRSRRRRGLVLIWCKRRTFRWKERREWRNCLSS